MCHVTDAERSSAETLRVAANKANSVRRESLIRFAFRFVSRDAKGFRRGARSEGVTAFIHRLG